MRASIVHEIIHLYQGVLPLWFAEAGAYWYAQQILKSEGWGTWATTVSTNAANFYQTLIDKYGEDVIHGMALESSLYSNKHLEVLQEFTPETQKKYFQIIRRRVNQQNKKLASQGVPF